MCAPNFENLHFWTLNLKYILNLFSIFHKKCKYFNTVKTLFAHLPKNLFLICSSCSNRIWKCTKYFNKHCRRFVNWPVMGSQFSHRLPSNATSEFVHLNCYYSFQLNLMNSTENIYTASAFQLCRFQNHLWKEKWNVTENNYLYY